MTKWQISRRWNVHRNYLPRTKAGAGRFANEGCTQYAKRINGKKSQKNDGSHNWEAGKKYSSNPNIRRPITTFARGLSKYYLAMLVRKTWTA